MKDSPNNLIPHILISTLAIPVGPLSWKASCVLIYLNGYPQVYCSFVCMSEVLYLLCNE